MRPLQERLENLRKEYMQREEMECELEKIVDKISHILPRSEISGSTGQYTGSVIIFPKSVDDVEMRILSEIREALGTDFEWTKKVTKDDVIYIGMYKHVDGKQTSPIIISLYPGLPGTCRIVQIPTGKKTLVSKHITEEVDEIKYEVQCSD